MAELLRLGSFAVFVALGLRARAAGEAGRRRAVQLLIGYTVAVSLAAGALQRDDWPFTSHTIAVGRARADSRVCQTRFYGVDAAGTAWRLDPYTFTPVYDSILQFWIEQALPRLGEADRERALQFLLQRAERSRQRLARGRAIGPQRLLGRAGAPYWLLLPRATEVPPSPYARLRIYSVCWTLDDLPRAGDRALTWRLTAEWPPAQAPAAD